MAKKISEVLVQKSFRNEYHKAGIALMVAHNQINALHQQFMKDFGITLQQFNALRILRGQYPNSCNLLLLRERMIDRMSDVSRIIERLKTFGWVERNISENDRREVVIKITDKGLKLLTKMDKDIDKMNYPINQLTKAEAKQLTRLLEKIIV